MRQMVHESEQTRKATQRGLPVGGVGFDWMMTLLSGVFLAGVYLDVSAHAHGRVDGSFFTPWHAIMYSGYFAVAGFLFATMIRDHARGHPWLRALPGGYELSLVGALLWLPGGMSDLIWHQSFGLEVGFEALHSPPHLVLAFGLGLIVTGPLRSEWRRPGVDGRGWQRWLPMLLSLTFMLSVCTLMTLNGHPLVNLWGRGSATVPQGYVEVVQILGVFGILFTTALFMGAVLLALARWMLPAGALTLIFTVNGLAMGLLHTQGSYPVIHVAALAAAGAVADLLLFLLKPSLSRTVALRLFAFAVPVVVYLFHFLTLMLAEGIAWSVHLWAGSIGLAGIVGWLLSYLLVPPQAGRMHVSA